METIAHRKLASHVVVMLYHGLALFLSGLRHRVAAAAVESYSTPFFGGGSEARKDTVLQYYYNT